MLVFFANCWRCSYSFLHPSLNGGVVLVLGSGTHSYFYPGFNVETVEYKNISFTVWDVGGQDKVC